ncbi:hypothetical protein [Frigidibacter oleivorans]|uniref:hypothetical protein n=1 Tax=Frigidibacter oleivorans TaxID=2487129 RepID=UPI000F8D267C|nr:hypothetical protein [Frigidibacter oleivorans]
MPAFPARHIAAVLLPACLTLAACVATAPAPPDPQIGEVEFAGETYPVFATPYGWRVRVDDVTVACRRDTLEDCYWSMRNRRTAVAHYPDGPFAGP